MGSSYPGGLYFAEYANSGAAPVVTFLPFWASSVNTMIGPTSIQPVPR